MKVASLFFICLALVTALHADMNNTLISASPTDNTSIIMQQAKEIVTLQAQVQRLQKELESYKKVKPLSSQLLATDKAQTSQVIKEGKKFSLPEKAPEELSVYYSAAAQSVNVISWQLELNGFTILAKDRILEGKTVISFTNESLKNTNSFLSVLHLLVNENKEIRVQNPSYFAAAYLQEKYRYGDFSATLQALDTALGGMHEVEEKYKFSDLASYHFMIGMPRVEDTVLLARGDDLKSKVNDVNVSEHVAYRLPLPNGDLLVGHKLKQSTYEYLKNIKAENNALLFPYNVIIANDQAFMLAPKYYLALSLPLLSMTDFLKIASAPEVIVQDIKQVYK